MANRPMMNPETEEVYDIPLNKVDEAKRDGLVSVDIWKDKKGKEYYITGEETQKAMESGLSRADSPPQPSSSAEKALSDARPPTTLIQEIMKGMTPENIEGNIAAFSGAFPAMSMRGLAQADRGLGQIAQTPALRGAAKAAVSKSLAAAKAAGRGIKRHKIAAGAGALLLNELSGDKLGVRRRIRSYISEE